MNLITTSEMVEYTHHLMNQGIYDDVMLDIIDTDPVYAQGFDFRLMLETLGCQISNIEQAKRVVCYQIIHPYCCLPPNMNGLRDKNLYYDFFKYVDIWDECLIDMDKIINLIYALDDATAEVHNGYVQKDYNDEMSILKLEHQIFQECHNWITRNQPQIQNIFTELFS